MSRSLAAQAVRLQSAMAGLVAKYQFRDRHETVCHDLTVSQAYALRALSEAGPLPMSALAGRLHLSGSALTRVVDRLVERRLVGRGPSDIDRRICEVRLTRRGRALWDKVEASLAENDAEVLRGFTHEEREVVIRAIGDLSSAVDCWRARQSGLDASV